MAKAPVSIHRQPDGRHHVVDADGKVLGKHKSVWSAARQVHEYMPQGGQPMGTNESGSGPHPPVPRPAIPKPAKTTAPDERPQRIPRP